jgi:hypothetical protein
MKTSLQKSLFQTAALLASLLFVGTALSCSHSSTDFHRNPSSVAGDGPQFCGAVRGNGELIMSHLSSYAALSENFGLFDGMAGGSSGSLSIFLYESVIQNPALRDCGTPGQPQTCTPAQVGIRASLLFKSIFAHINKIKNSKDAQDAIQLSQSLNDLKKGLGNVDIQTIDPVKLALLSMPKQRAQIRKLQKQLQAVMSNPTTRSLIDSRMYSIMLMGQADPVLGLPTLGKSSQADLNTMAYRLREVYTAASEIGNFNANDKNIFFRPGVVSFDGLARQFGRMANFYAGRGNPRTDTASSTPYLGDYDLAGMQDFLNSCAEKSRGLDWYDFTDASPECASKIGALIDAYQDTHTETSVILARIHEPVGRYMHALISAAIIQGDADNYKSYAVKYMNAPALGFQFQPGDYNVFSNVKFGYFGAPADVALLNTLTSSAGFTDDFKVKNRVLFSGASWEEVLNYSPAEPGLSALTLPEQLHYLPADSDGGVRDIQPVVGAENTVAAGWSDLTPTIELRNLGCKTVIYVTRREPESLFTQGVIRQMGATQDQLDALYSLDQPSSFSRSLAAADGVWCTDWNALDLDAPNFQGEDHDAFVETHLEGANPDALKALLLNPSSSFASRITPHQYQGCGGTTPVPRNHKHVAMDAR